MRVNHTELHRTRAFDRIMEATDRVFEDADILHRLGSLASALDVTTQDIFLPNIRHGVASVPKGIEQTDSYALIPWGRDEGNLQLDASMQRQTARRFENNGVYIRDGACTVPIGFTSKISGAETTRLTLDSLDAYSSRPVILFDSQYSSNPEFKDILAPITVHEAQHAIDFDAVVVASELSGKDKRAWLELRGFSAGYAVFMRQSEIMPPPIACREAMQIHCDVEFQRRLHAEAGDPFKPSGALVSYLDAAGCLPA